MAKKISVKGTIIPSNEQAVYDWLGWEATSPKVIEKALSDANGEEINVEVNSGGGETFAGFEIYTALRDYKGKVMVDIVGLAASAASVIAMSGDVVRISPPGQIMIHNASVYYADGDHNKMTHMSGVLKGIDKSMANAYMLKTGMAQKELLKLMNKETWLTAQEAVEMGFADEIKFDEGGQLVANAGSSPMLSRETVEKINNLLLKETVSSKLNNEVTQESNSAENSDLDSLYLRAKILKLKGEMCK